MYPVHVIAAARSNWQPPSAIPGLVTRRDRNDPALLPIPRPIRKTARIMENV